MDLPAQRPASLRGRPSQRRGPAGRLDRAPLRRERHAGCACTRLWLPQPRADAPVLLYLHGARRNVSGSAVPHPRMHELGFSVLAIDYRGFGKSTRRAAVRGRRAEDARAAWDWLAREQPQRAALHLRPLAGRRHRGAARRRGGRRARADRRRHLHLDPRRVQQLQVGLAAGRAADHAALRFGAEDRQGRACRCWWCTAARIR